MCWAPLSCFWSIWDGVRPACWAGHAWPVGHDDGRARSALCRHCVFLYEGRLGVFRVVFGVFRAVCRVVPHDGALRRHCVVLRVRHCVFPRAML